MAQSTMKSPIGVRVYWKNGANPTNEWQTWFSTFKMAVMAKENMHLNQLLRLKPTPNDLFYPIMPTFEERVENASEDEESKREIRNERRSVDWENECKQIRNRGPMIDRYTWNEADLKVDTSFERDTSYTNLPSEKSPYHDRSLFHKQTRLRAGSNLRSSTQSNFRQIPVDHSPTKSKRKSGDILQPITKTRLKSSPG